MEETQEVTIVEGGTVDLDAINTHSNGSTVTEQSESARFTIFMPNLDDTDHIAAFDARLQEGVTDKVYGIMNLRKEWNNFKYHKGLCDQNWAWMQESVARINGLRTQTQKVGDSKRSARAVAKQYFTSLSVKMLQAQCGLFGLSYDTYPDKDAVIEALTDHHVASMEVEETAVAV